MMVMSLLKNIHRVLVPLIKTVICMCERARYRDRDRESDREIDKVLRIEGECLNERYWAGFMPFPLNVRMVTSA